MEPEYEQFTRRFTSGFQSRSSMTAGEIERFAEMQHAEIERLKHLNECASCATDQPNGPNPALICRQCAKESYDEQHAEIERLRTALRDVQWKLISGRPGTSAYPTCIGCGIVSHGSLSTPEHEDTCTIENALQKGDTG